MASPGAAEADREVALTLAPVERQQEFQQASEFVDKAPRLRLRHHVFMDMRIEAGQRTQLRHEERIGGEAHVDPQVEPTWLAVFVAERYQRERHPPAVRRPQYRGSHHLAQFMDG